MEIESLPDSRSAEKLDVGGRVVLPGFVDSHTHLIHAASRAEEYELKITGASYEEIARKGGGILNSVKKLRAATAETLKKRAHAALREFAAHGTTTLEAKSGYGLDVASELKILRLHKELGAEQPLEIVSTFLGAHTVPVEFRDKPDGSKQYIALLISKLIPEVAARELAEFCDVFCDRGAFSRGESDKILRAGRERHGSDAAWRYVGCGELRSPGASEPSGHTGAGQIKNGGHIAAWMRFSSRPEKIRACACADRGRSQRGARDRL